MLDHADNGSATPSDGLLDDFELAVTAMFKTVQLCSLDDSFSIGNLWLWFWELLMENDWSGYISRKLSRDASFFKDFDGSPLQILLQNYAVTVKGHFEGETSE